MSPESLGMRELIHVTVVPTGFIVLAFDTGEHGLLATVSKTLTVAQCN